MQFPVVLTFTRQRLACIAMFASLSAFGTIVSHSAYAADQAAQQNTQDAGASSDVQKINHLLELIDQRLAFASDVAKTKWNSSTVIDDPVREKEILAAISEKATAMGVTNLALVEVFFQNQFEASKIIQTRLIMHWHSIYPADFKFKDAPDLADDIRPKLDRLTPDLIIALQDVQAVVGQPAMHTYLLNKSKQLVRDDVNGEARHAALMTFESE